MLQFEAYSWPLIFLLALAGLLTWFSYRRTEPKLSGVNRWILPRLRGAALTLLLFLLSEPVLHRTLRQENPPLLAVLIDESQSMSRHKLMESFPAIDREVRLWSGATSPRRWENWIQYRHLIGKMVRKPDVLPIVANVQIFSHHPFRTVYDALKRTRTVSIQADKVYLKDLYLAARERGSGVGAASDQVPDFVGTFF